RRNENFRGSATGPFLPKIPACYQGDGSRPGVCICICNCNDAIDTQWNVVPWHHSYEYYYHELAKEMVLWEYAIAVVGGEARQWGIANAYNIAADRCRKVMRSHGVLVVDGIVEF
ncbi:MAG: hypothetical protein GY772_28140, partial [bacterium]|nr:hypothetical protein [bacterium]